MTDVVSSYFPYKHRCCGLKLVRQNFKVKAKLTRWPRTANYSNTAGLPICGATPAWTCPQWQQNESSGGQPNHHLRIASVTAEDGSRFQQPGHLPLHPINQRAEWGTVQAHSLGTHLPLPCWQGGEGVDHPCSAGAAYPGARPLSASAGPSPPAKHIPFYGCGQDGH